MQESSERRPLPIVLLPAMLCDEELYRPQIDGLRDLVEPLALAVAEPTMVDAAATVLRQAPSRFLLAGTSYGGNLALEVVAAAPSRVLGLWLMGCNPGAHRDLAMARLRNDRVQRGQFEAVVEELAAVIAYEEGPHGADAARSFRRMARRAGPTVFLRQNTSLLGRPDRRGDLAHIGCPTLLVWGQEDRLSAVEHGRDMGARIPEARLLILEGCGHLPTLERPDATLAAVRDWLGVIGLRAVRPDDQPGD